jgi:inhibitor of cysteine peptidase
MKKHYILTMISLIALAAMVTPSTYSDDLDFYIPYAEYNGQSYAFELRHVEGLDWKLDPASVTNIPASDIYTDGDNGRSINIQLGRSIRVVLESNPTTGYTWRIKNFDLDVLQITNNVYLSNTPQVDDGPPWEGVGGKDAWTFQAIGAGTTQIELLYSRSWIEDDSDARSFILDVQVQ